MAAKTIFEKSFPNWKPLVLKDVTAKTLKSDVYRRFIEESVLLPGCRLLLERHRQRPDWPFVETKFNPNTGLNLSDAAYQVVHVWLLGRGSEVLDDHLHYLSRGEFQNLSEQAEIREVFSGWIESMTSTLATLMTRYGGRLPFRVNRDGVALDDQGRPCTVNAAVAGAGDVFGLKGLLSSTDPAKQRLSRDMMRRVAKLVREDRVESEQRNVPPGWGQGMRMLLQGAGGCVARKAREAGARAEALTEAAACMGEILNVFYDPETALFAEYADPETGTRSTYLDPGHANEFVGLGLGMIEALELSPWAGSYGTLITRAKRELPRLLIKAFALGYNPKYPGLFKAVDNRTGAVINADMPWWNLPETMRAAIRACAVAESDAIRQECLNIFARCHNAYFINYPNRENALFPFQTIDGRTGKVADIVPAVPEGDPLYHANGSLLDLLEVVERL